MLKYYKIFVFLLQTKKRSTEIISNGSSRKASGKRNFNKNNR